MHLVSSKLENLGSTESQQLQVEFSMDLPDLDSFNQEIARWKGKWQDCAAKAMPTNLKDALNACNPAFFPNIGTIIQLLLCSGPFLLLRAFFQCA